MNLESDATPEGVKARLTLDVSYVLNGEHFDDLVIHLHQQCRRAIGQGLLTGSTAAEVDTWSMDVRVLPSQAEGDALQAEIAAFMQQRIEDGDLAAEDIPARLARYGLMDPEAFAAEMRERMEMATGDAAEDPPLVTAPATAAPAGKFAMQVAVACANASGMLDMPVFTVRTTQEDYDLGRHYDQAEALAQEAGYDGPFVCFDHTEHAAILSAAQELGLVPQVVVVDMTDGQIHSVCCDAGKIKVICYDTRDTDEQSAAVADRPVGENGQLVRCWAHTQFAQVDPGLKRARD